jgi:hypothetical protein
MSFSNPRDLRTLFKKNLPFGVIQSYMLLILDAFFFIRDPRHVQSETLLYLKCGIHRLLQYIGSG